MKKIILIFLLLIINIIIQNNISILYIPSFIIDCLLILLLFGIVIEKNYLNSRVPDLMYSRRNYEKLLICDEQYVKKIDIDKDNTLILSNYNRNFYTDFKILQRYYSFLHTNGECIFVFDFNRYSYFKNRKINSIDYPFLHVVTLYENNIKYNSIRYKTKRLLDKYKILFYKIEIYKIKDNRKINIEQIEMILEELNNFVKERNIYVKILIKNSEYNIQKKYSNIKYEEI